MSSQHESALTQNVTPATGGSPEASTTASSKGTATVKAGLRGHGLEAQEAMLAPSGADPGTPPADPVGAASSGPPGDLPFRADLEASFGQDLGHIRVFLGQPGPLIEVGARALTRGTTIVFADSAPDKTLVAEEVAHVLQNAKGRASKPYSTNADGSEKRAKTAATKAAAGEKVDVDAVGTADADVQAGWIGNSLSAVGSYLSKTGTYVKESFVGGSTDTDVTPDQWRQKQHAFMAQYGARGGAEEDAICEPTLVADQWFGSYFVYNMVAYDLGVQAWNANIAKMKNEVKFVMPAWMPTFGPVVPPPELNVEPAPAWVDFRPPATRDGIPAVKEEMFADLKERMELSRAGLKGEIIQILNDASVKKESAVTAVAALKTLLGELKTAALPVPGSVALQIPTQSQQRLLAFHSFYSSTGEAFPEIYSHPLMAGNPAAVLALADLLNPIADLKSSLEIHKTDRAACMAIITAWARQHPSLGQEALADPAVKTIVYTAGVAAGANEMTTGAGGAAALIGGLTLNPLLGFGGLAMTTMGGAAADQVATVDNDTMRMVKLLQGGGHLEGADVESTAREAIMAGDSDAFLRAWGQIVHQKAVFERLTTDDRFRKDVREKVPDAWDSFLSTIKVGAIDSNVTMGLTKEEQKLVEQYSGPCIRELTDAFNPGIGTLGMVRNASVTNPLQGWNRQISNALATDKKGVVSTAAWDSKLREARYILRALYQAREGKSLYDEICDGIGDNYFSAEDRATALNLIGHQGMMEAKEVKGFGEAGKIATTDATTVESYGEELSDKDKSVLKYSKFLEISGKLYRELERTSCLNGQMGIDVRPRGAEVIAFLGEARAEARKLLAPAQLDTYPALQKPFSKKVTQSMAYLAEVYNDAYEAEGQGKGSLRLRMSRELSEGDQTRALQLIGATPAPTQHLADAAMAQLDKEAQGVSVGSLTAMMQAGSVEKALDELQTHASTHALKIWQQLKFSNAPKTIEDMGKAYIATVPLSVDSAIKQRPTLKTMPMEMLKSAYTVLGGSLGGHIVDAFKADAAGAQSVLDAFGLGPIGRYAVAEDGELLAALTKLDEDDAALETKKGDKGANKQEIAKDTQKNAELRALVQAQIPVRQQLAYLSGQIFRALEASPTQQDRVVSLLGELAKVDGREADPVDAIGPNQARDGVPSVQVLKGQRLDCYIYKKYQGIEITLHLGRNLDDTHRESAEKATGLVIPASGGARADMSILKSNAALDKLGDELKIDETRVHGNIESAEGWSKNQSFMTQAATIVQDLDARLNTLEKASKAPSIVGAVVTHGASLAASNGAFSDAKRELLIAVASIGTGEERRIVDALFEKACGVSLKFRLGKVSMVAGNENAEQMRRLAEGRLTAVDHLRAMVESGDKDEVYRQVFKASPAMKKNILKDDHLLRLIATKFDTEFLQNITRVCEGTQQAADLLMGRDADAGGKSAFYSWVATMGWSTDEAGMKSDLELHLGALKDQITEANSKHVIAKGECLWSITERLVGDPTRWKELYAENQATVGKNPNLIYARVTLKLPAAWIKVGSAKALAKEYMRIVLDPDVRSILGEQLSAKERFEMESIVAGGGTVSPGNQAMLDLDAANGAGFIEQIKKMTDVERKGLLADASFVALMVGKLDGATYQQAMSILATGATYDKLSDLLGALSGNDYGIINTIDEKKIFDALGAMGTEELLRLKKSPVLAARVQSFLDKRPADSAVFKEYMDSAIEAPDPKATPDEKRTAELKRARTHLMAKLEIRLRSAAESDRDALYDVAIEVYKEKGEVVVPVAGSPAPKANKKGGDLPVTPTETVSIFGDVAREELWRKVATVVVSKHSGKLADMVRDAVLKTKDPATDRLKFMLSSTVGFGQDIEGAKKAITSAADITVARDWSNVVQPDQNGLTLKHFYEAFAFARGQLTAADKQLAFAKKKADREALAPMRAKAYGEFLRRYTEFKGFRLDLNKTMRGAVTNEGTSVYGFEWLNIVGTKNRLALREAIRERIAGLPKEAVGQAIGIIDEDGKLLASNGASATLGKGGAPATTSTMTLTRNVPGQKEGTTGSDVGVEMADLDLLMSDDRAARMGDVSVKEGYEHTRGDSGFGKGVASKDLNKSATKVAYYNASLDQAEERKAGEEVSTVDANESEELKVQLAAVKRTFADYSSTKAFYANIIKGVVVAVIAAVSTALTAGAAAPLWATMLTAGVSAGAKVAIDELILGNDYEALKDGIPMIIGETVAAGLEQSIGEGMKSLAARDNMFSKGLAWKMSTQESLKAYLKTAGPLTGALTEGLMGGFGVVTDPWLDPVTRFLKPETWSEVYKHGLQSSWQTGMTTLDKKLREMPGTFVSTVATTFLTQLGTRGAAWAMKGDAVKATPGLPGLALEPVRPKENACWEHIGKALETDFTLTSMGGGNLKAAYTFIAKQLVAEGVLSLKDGHTFGDSWTEEGIQALVLEFGTERVKALIAGIGAGVGAHNKVKTALQRVEQQSENLSKLAYHHDLDIEKLKDMYYQFITSESDTKPTGKLSDLYQNVTNPKNNANVTAFQFEQQFLLRRVDAFKKQEAAYEEECKAKKILIDPTVVSDYKAWLFADPTATETRAATGISAYTTNAEALQKAGATKHMSRTLTVDQQEMYKVWSKSAGNLGDVAKTELNDEIKFKESYLVTKQTATMLNLGTAIEDKTRKAAFKAWLSGKSVKFWDKPERRFSLANPDEVKAKVAVLVEEFNKANPQTLKVKPPTP